MITKKLFIDFISKYQNFDKGIERIGEALTGKTYHSLDLYECDWIDSVGYLLDIFLESHFTVEGCDLIVWWMYENVDKIITQKVDPDLFNGESELTYDVENIEDLWDYMIKYKSDYFLNE